LIGRADVVEIFMSLTFEELTNPKFIGPEYINRVVEAANTEIRRLATQFPTVPEQPAIVTAWGIARAELSARLPKELVYISDNGHTGATEQPVADQAADEIRGRLNTIDRAFEVLSGQKTNTLIRYQDIASQDVLGGAAALYQAVVGELPIFGRSAFLNVAPRKEESGKQEDNGGETVYVALHPNGTPFGGTGPHCFSLFKDDIAKGDILVFKANVAIKGSQFRSRDFFTWSSYANSFNLPRFAEEAGKPISPERQREILSGFNFVDINTPLKAEQIPDVPNDGAVVTSIDVHGNLKTALRGRDLTEAFPQGGAVYVLAHGKLLKAEIASASFEKHPGTIALSRGSTYRDPLNLADSNPAAVEIFKVGGRVADDLLVGAPHLRQGLEFHVFDAALFNQAFKVTGLGDDAPPSDKADFAAQLVQRGFVKGLNNNVLSYAVQSKTLRVDGGKVHGAPNQVGRLDA
jgi:hypothetical protein